MNTKLRHILLTLVPFLFLGIVIALLIGMLVMLSYVVLWGLLIGGILWIVAALKNFLFPAKIPPETEGRIIEHNERK